MKSIICACITIGLVRLAAVAIRVANMYPVYVYDGVLFHLFIQLNKICRGWICIYMRLACFYKMISSLFH